MPVWTASSHGVDWRLELERDALLPGRLVGGRVDVVAHRDIDARALIVGLRGVEHWKHEVSTTDSEGRTQTHVETARTELVREPVAVAGALHLGPGESRTWTFDLPVPPLGPASLAADVAGLDWTVEAKLDLPGGLDSAIERPVTVLQPVALLRAGVVPVGEFALYDGADVGADGVTGSVVLKPVPLACGAPFTAEVTIHAGLPRRLQEVRAELRVQVEATVPNGLSETVTAWQAALAVTELQGDRTLSLSGVLDPRPLPSIELPHGRTSATFHVILATAWAADPHLVRDVAIATTLEL